jgi:hypothetical protein
MSTLLLCGQASAAGVWTNGQQLIGALMWKPGAHGFYVKAGTYDNPAGCSNNTSNLYLLDPAIEADVATTNRLLAMISLALAQEKTVFVWVDGCQNGSPVFTGLQVNN